MSSSTGGTAITNVLSNDMTNGQPSTFANSTISAVGTYPAGISLNTATGAVTVAAGTTPGNYPITYQLCDKLTPMTCATVVDTIKVTPLGSIGNVIWNDANGDGLFNESSTNGINGVKVYLHKDDGTGTYVIVDSTVTATNSSNNPGYYNFVLSQGGNYKVQFPLTVFGGGITIQTPAAGVDNNSDADPTTGFSPIIVMDLTGSGVQVNNPTIDAGYKNIAPPVCNMTASIGVNQISQCVTNNNYQFTGNFTGGTAPYTYLWDFNDGTYGYTQNPSHTYATAGEHDVTFIVKDIRGCEAHASTVQIYIGAKPKASFDIYTHSGNGAGFTFVSTSTISGGWLNYNWDLGNGETSTLVNPGPIYYAPGTYTITLIATGNLGCSDTIKKVITIDANNNYCTAPIAKFDINNANQCLSGNAFVFTNMSTENPTSYLWNFGDGSATVSTANASHSYVSANTYNVSLTAVNA